MLQSASKWFRRASAPAAGEEHPPAPKAPLICLRIGGEDAAALAPGAALVIARLARQRPDLRLLVALPEEVELALPETVERRNLQEEGSPKALLRQVAPDLVVLFGNDLPGALIKAADRADVPVMMVDVQAAPNAARKQPFSGFGKPPLLRRMARVLVRDQASVTPLLQLGVEPCRLEVGGVLGQPSEPLRCSEAERVSMAALTRTRPVWLAAEVPAEEMASILAAQERAQHHAHRMLLILAPEDPESACALVEDLTARGLAVASRSVEGEPEDETEVFLADDPGEYGLWYRIAPVTYMGGTLTGGTAQPRSPFEPAALGSAVLHGPKTGAYTAEYARLGEARAARAIHDAISLGEAVADLMSPDRAAVLAHNAWAVTSGGAAAAEAVVRAILGEYEGAKPRKET
ncbi:3-deoxy-D-manno-octulosonic-acid transferase [Rhodobacter aestuarii]|uniref:3-deoxy-D-manno-octulosonic acid transferase n=1 Tax=Rhodobacter aestuarii TaxID=453582 RepID=A0A1N7PSM8_9RHOB|nr:glycosyltransferase N-terminal domain-containing protein [Rhodobacter aestuarii]PTV94195.1 3-deoxy-D-manno-octulosonic-acid transferase [Rhodobacter aestuarii]SIT13611.1 3-deoxy-D-manno-octulosonic-acid transferase [Rhodobacter aestuarii]